MKRLTTYIKNLPQENILTKKELLLTIACSFMLGMIIGIFTSSMKKGLTWFSNNKLGNNKIIHDPQVMEDCDSFDADEECTCEVEQ